MVLVDTSVLIDYFKGQSTEPVAKLDNLIQNDLPFGICNFVYQEILQGARTQQEFDTLKNYVTELPFYDLKDGIASFEQASMINFHCRRAGITVRSTIDIDLLIAQIAIEQKLQLLHDDKDFDFIANVVEELAIYR